MKELDKIIALLAEINEELDAITTKLESEDGQTLQQEATTETKQEGEKE